PCSAEQASGTGPGAHSSHLAPSHRDDPAALANLFFLRRERLGFVRLVLGQVPDHPRLAVELELVAVPRVLDPFPALHPVEPETQRVSPEDVAHVGAADNDHLTAGFLGNALQSRRRHFARGADREAVARDEEGLARMHPPSEIGHEVTERARLPAFVQSLQTLGDAILGGRDLIGVDRVQLLPWALGDPDDQGAPADRLGCGGRSSHYVDSSADWGGAEEGPGPRLYRTDRASSSARSNARRTVSMTSVCRAS